MRTRLHRLTAGAVALAVAGTLTIPPSLPAQTPAAKPAVTASASDASAPQDKWPRKMTVGGNTISLYTPQLDAWDGRTIEYHAAVSIESSGSKEPTFGVLFGKAKTDVDKTTRTVQLTDREITKVNFPSAPAANDTYRSLLEKAMLSRKPMPIALDRLEANLAILEQQKKGESQPLKNEPPKVIFSSVPAIVVLVDGDPVWRPVEKTGVERVINTSPIVLKDETGTLYLHLFDGWLQAPALTGPWVVSANPPASLSAPYKAILDAKSGDPLSGGVPDDPDARDVKQPTLKTGPVPVVYVATAPTELIVTDGQPDYVPIDGTQLLYVKNTTGRVFKNIADQNTYVLLSGRWFSAPGPEGPWTFVPFESLPKDFASIPDESPMENVKASVPGTQQAQEAVVSNSVPQTAAVEVSKTKPQPVKVDGAPQMKPIEGTSMQYVVNASSPIIMVTPSAFYLCQNGVWFIGASASGPWSVATSVPAVIYSIPPSSPVYNVTYVRVYEATPTVVYVGYTPGYQGAVIYNGVVVYGTGYYYTPWIGTVWYGPPVTYGFGIAIGYSPWTGWAYGFGYGCGWGWGHVTVGVGWGWGGWGWGCAWGGWYGGWHGGWYGAAWGVHGGAVWGPGYARWSSGNVYHSWNGTSGVSRSGGGYNAWTGNAWHGQSGAAYNSKTGTLAAGQRGSVSNVYTGNYASGGRGVATNTKTGATAAARGGTVGNAYTGNSVSGGQAKVYNPNTGNTTKVGGVTSSNGGGAARVGDTAVGKTSSGDYYASHDGNVYKNTGDGWQQKTSNGWENTLKGSSQQQELSKQSQARQTGEQRYNSFQSNGGASRAPSNWDTGAGRSGASRQMSRPSGGRSR
ncbi:MAG TPA: autotransporter [Thermoanaerobaculia bacterium]